MEETTVKETKKSTFSDSIRSVWQIIRPHRKMFFLSVAASTVLVFVQLGQARLTQALIDHISAGRIRTFAVTAAGFFALIGSAALLHYLRQLTAGKMSAGAVRDLKCSVSESLLNADYREISLESSGNAMSTVNQDISAVGQFLSRGFSNVFSQLALALGTFIYILCMEPKLGLISFVYLPFGVWLTFCVNRKMAGYYTEMAEESGKSLSVVEQVLTQIPVIKSFLMEKHARARIYKSYGHVFQQQKKTAAWGILLTFLVTTTLQIPRLTYFAVGGFMVIGGALSIGTFVSLFDLLAYITQPVTSLPWLLQGLNQVIASVRRIRRLQELPSEEKPEEVGGRVFEGAPAPCIDIQRISFAYREGRRLFRNFSFFQDEPGITVICGPSGSGKTTLLDLISGLYRPECGHISVNGEISAVLQDTFLFSGSLLENVRLAKPDASDEEVTDALKKAGAYDFARALPEGLHTNLGDGGQSLSGGQRQRIGLARTILQDSPIWLLDEPTSALDPETEQIILDVIEQERTKKIIIISAHRQSLIALADRKVML